MKKFNLLFILLFTMATLFACGDNNETAKAADNDIVLKEDIVVELETEPVVDQEETETVEESAPVDETTPTETKPKKPSSNKKPTTQKPKPSQKEEETTPPTEPTIPEETTPPVEVPEPTKPTEPEATTPTEPETTTPPVQKPETESNLVYLGRFKLTAYCPCSKCNGKWAGGITSTGVMAKANHTIAVDPKVISYGSKVVINGHTYTAEDCGGAIKGKRIDVYFNTHSEALRFGVQYADVYLKK